MYHKLGNLSKGIIITMVLEVIIPKDVGLLHINVMTFSHQKSLKYKKNFWPLCCESFYCIINFFSNKQLLWFINVTLSDCLKIIILVIFMNPSIIKMWQWKMSFIEFRSSSFRNIFSLVLSSVINTNIVSVMKISFMN